MTLPAGWAYSSLGDITVQRVTQDEPGDTPVPYIDIGSIDRDTKQIGTTQKVTAATAPTRARQWVHTGDVLVSLTRPNLNAVAMVTPEYDEAVASTGFDVLRAEGVLPSWIFYRVRSQAFIHDVCEDVQGVVYPAVRPTDVRRHILPLAPLPEQARVIEALDSFLSRLENAVANLQRAQARLKAYRASVLKAAVDGRLVPTEAGLARAKKRDYEPADVSLKRILAERRRRWEETEFTRLRAAGKSPKDDIWKLKYEEPIAPDTADLPELPEGWCWASPGQVFDWASGEFLPKKAQKPGQVPVFGGNGINGVHDEPLIHAPTLVVGRVGANCGNVHMTDGPAWITDNAIYAVDPPRDLNLAYWRVALSIQNLNANAGGTGQPYVNQRHLNELLIPVAPVEEQARIVTKLDELLSVAAHTAGEASRTLQRCALLRQATLHWAFEGRLVDQHASDEPAEDLLARIRAERVSVPSNRKNRDRKP